MTVTSVVYRWKVEEACLLALGSASQLLLLALDEQRVQLDINVLLQNVVYARFSQNGASLAYYGLMA